MELWPATDEEQFEFIKQIIQQCDYYIVISAGMYGSIHPETGVSYTEMEFDYAQELEIPTIRLLHRDPFNSLMGSEIESTATAKKKLKAFQQKLRDGKLCRFWETPTELGREVILSLNDIKKRKPAQGWVRSNDVAATDAIIEIAELRREVSELKLRQANEPVPRDVEGFLDRLSGNVSLHEYELVTETTNKDPFSVETDPFYVSTIRFRFRDYRASGATVQISKEYFAHGIMFGLLVSESAKDAIVRGFASSATDEIGYPLRIIGDAEESELDELFMSLESEGLIISGEKYSTSFNNSFATAYPWKLSPIAREWILKNPPDRK